MIKTLDLGINRFAGGPCQDRKGQTAHGGQQVSLCQSRERASRHCFHTRPPTLWPAGHANLSSSWDFN